MSIKEILTRVLNRLPRHIRPYVDRSYTTRTADTWEYTGLLVEVPENHIYITRARTSYTHGRPYGLGFHSETALGSWGAPVQNIQSPIKTEAMAMGTFMLLPGTYYLYCKRAGTGVNTYTINCVDISV